MSETDKLAAEFDEIVADVKFDTLAKKLEELQDSAQELNGLLPDIDDLRDIENRLEGIQNLAEDISQVLPPMDELEKTEAKLEGMLKTATALEAKLERINDLMADNG